MIRTSVICTVKGIQPYSAPDETCLDVAPDKYYAVTKQSDPTWWCARLIEGGLITGRVGLIPSDHVEVVGNGFIMPGFEEGFSGNAKKERKKKKKTSKRAPSSHGSPKKEGSEHGAEVFARILGEKDRELEQLNAQVQQLAQENAALKKKLGSLSTCFRCGVDLSDQMVHVHMDSGHADEDGEVSVAKLVAEGYDKEVLLKVKSIIRSMILRRRFRKVALDFKKNKASLVMRLRNDALREIYTSEKKYVEALEVALQEYYQPLLRVANSRHLGRPMISRGDVSDIFSTLEIIVDLNRGLMQDLKERLDKWPGVQKFGDLFIRMAPILRLYSGYMRNFEHANATLVSLRESNAGLNEFLKERETLAHGLNLESYLIMPVQRLPRYQLLLQGLLKYTDANHVDHSDLTLAQERIVDICFEINAQKQIDENVKTLRALVEDVEGLLPNLAPCSYFIHRGHLHSIMGTGIGSFHYILFNDLLIKASSTKKKTPAWVVSEVVGINALVNVIDIPDMEGIKNCFELHFSKIKEDDAFNLEKKVTLGLCAPTSADKSIWITKIRSALALFPLEPTAAGENAKRGMQEATATFKEEMTVASGSLSARDMLTLSQPNAGQGSPSATLRKRTPSGNNRFTMRAQSSSSLLNKK